MIVSGPPNLLHSTSDEARRQHLDKTFYVCGFASQDDSKACEGVVFFKGFHRRKEVCLSLWEEKTHQWHWVLKEMNHVRELHAYQYLESFKGMGTAESAVGSERPVPQVFVWKPRTVTIDGYLRYIIHNILPFGSFKNYDVVCHVKYDAPNIKTIMKYIDLLSDRVEETISSTFSSTFSIVFYGLP